MAEQQAEKPLDELVFREQLSLDRTALSNERTFLSYIRTALAVFLTGATLIKFYASLILAIVGWGMIGGGLFIFVIGFLRYRRIKQKLIQINQKKFKSDLFDLDLD
jgi:putative membrane protein